MKLYFLRRAESQLANPAPAVLDSVRGELLRRPGNVEASSAEDAEAIVLNEPWLFRQWRYIDDLIADPVVGRFPYKTYTINSDDAGTGLLRGVYCCLSARRFDARLHAAAPFLSRHNQMVIQRAGKVRGTPSYLATFKGNTKSNKRLRGELIEVCDRSKSLHGETSDKWLNHSDDEKTLFIDLLQSGKFSLCPAGWGAATFRIFESMALGVAPVIIADNFVPPKGPDWDEFSLRVAEKDIAQIEGILTEREGIYAQMGERAYEAWARYFSAGRIIPYYCDALMDCIRANDGPSSVDAEIGRWRSKKMYWANHWTLPQRVANRARRLLV